MNAEENADELLNAIKTELHALIEKLPISSLENLRNEGVCELEKIRVLPEVQAAKSRFHTITSHLWGALQRGEHAVVTAVHDFLMHQEQGQATAPAVEPAPASSPATEVSSGTIGISSTNPQQ